jgi:N utilization substance protein B
MDRTSARAAAMKLAYEWEMGGDGGDPTLSGILGIQTGENEADYMDTLVNGVKDNAGALDELIIKYLTADWKIGRLMKIDLSVLRVAIYEMAYLKLSVGVAINEAVELARAYSMPEAGPLINGVLGALARDMGL